MHNFMLYITLLKKYAPQSTYTINVYNFAKKKYAPYILYITLLNKICALHAIGIVCGVHIFLIKLYIYIYIYILKLI